MRPTRLILTSLVMLLAGVGCKPMLTVDAPEINITEKGLSFPGVVTTVPGSQQVTSSFKVVTSKLGAAASPDSSAIDRLQRMEITRVLIQAKSGVTDFSFLDHLKISAANWDASRGTNSTRPIVAILECPSGTQDCPLLYENIGTTLDFPLDPPVDLIPLWANTNLYIIITATGTVPKVDWSVDVTFSLSVRWST
jgi:hypothetical protein